MKPIHMASFAAVALLSLPACDRSDTRRDEQIVTPKSDEALAPKHIEKKEPGSVGGGPATVGERERARDRLAAARCDHYKTCGDVAKDKKYDSYDSCLVREKADIDKDWKVDDCAQIDDDRFNVCVTAVSGKKCDALFKSSPSECAESKVCMKKL